MENTGTVSSELAILWAVLFLGSLLWYSFAASNRKSHRNFVNDLHFDDSKIVDNTAQPEVVYVYVQAEPSESPPKKLPPKRKKTKQKPTCATDKNLMRDAAHVLINFGHKKKDAEKLVISVARAEKFDNVEDIITAAYAKS